MKKIIILSAATLVLSSCGIYNKYKPVSEVPEGLYGSETVAAHRYGKLRKPLVERGVYRSIFTESH